MPSHFSSHAHPSPVGGWAASVACIGFTFVGGAARSGSAGGSMRWIIHWLPRVWNNTYRPCHALAVERDHHLTVAPLVRLVRAGVPHVHRAAAVFALRDVAGKREVFHRVVFGVHREMVALRIGRDALRHRPRCEYAVALEPKIPVQRARVMLLHHEPGDRLLLRGALRTRAARLGCRVEVALAFVLLERLLTLARHAFTVPVPALVASRPCPTRS